MNINIIFAFICKKDFKSLGLVFCIKIFQTRILEKKDHGFHKKNIKQQLVSK